MSNVLTIDLCEGFMQTEVVVRVDGQEVLRDTVSTRMQIGLARRVVLNVAAAAVRVEVELPASGTLAELRVHILQRPFVVAELVADDLRLCSSARPGGFV